MKARNSPSRLYIYRLDARGRWHYGKNLVTDPGLARDFFAWLYRETDGTWWIECDGEKCKAVVEDAPQFVESVRCISGKTGGLSGVEITLASGRTETLDPGSLQSRPNGALYCRLANGMEAKFHRAPQLELARWVDDQLNLQIGGKLYPVRES